MKVKCECPDKKTSPLPNGKCKRCSRVKMVFLLKNEAKHLLKNGSSPVMYSYYKNNRQPIETIISKMIEASKKLDIYKNSNVIRFYDFGHAVGELKP